MEQYSINLSDNQIKKIASAVKKKADVSIQLKYSQLSGNHELLLTQRQINKIKTAKKDQKGVRLLLKYKQLKDNHVGGFLAPLFAAIGTLAGVATSIANSVINKKAKDKELEETKRHHMAMEGKGLKKNSTKKKSNR